ncbi:MAG: mechanosensitive ion channel domain-containing protein [Pseudomonadota bacterium]|nr:mechanosensitive ion channel domain-containing protein [Pseudomonadota bacterium]
MLNLESVDNKTREMIESIFAIGVELGVGIVGAITLLIIGTMIAGWVRRGTRHGLDRIPRIDETLKPFLAKLAWYVVMVFVLVAVLNQFGVQTASIIAVLGAAGLAIGLALQGTLANVASGVMLLLLRPFNVGDYVDAGGIAGTVVEIGLFNTEIKTNNGLCLIVPNSKIWDSPITNFSRNLTRRFDIPVGISYGDDVEGAITFLENLLDGDVRVLKEPERLVKVKELGDSAVIINLRGWTNSLEYWATVWDINKSIVINLQEAGYSIPFPQHDVHIVSGPS